MAKARAQKESKNSKSHLKVRQNFLNQSANYLQSSFIQHGANNAAQKPQSTSLDPTKPGRATADPHSAKKPLTNLSRVYISQMRGVSLKTQTRLPIPVKRSYCKRCDTLLVPDVSCSQEVQNSSRDRKKPWADVSVVHCLVCDTEKRFPQTERHSSKLSGRQTQLDEKVPREP